MRCGHDCAYCYAPYIMRVPPREWSTCIQAKMNLPVLLDKELPRRKGVIGLGTVTDPYQPAEASVMLTRRCLEVLLKHHARVSVLTKSALVARDADLLARMEGSEVGITITTIADDQGVIFEPGASPPSDRLTAMRKLHDAGINVYAFVGPIIPTITDRGLEELIDAISDAGAETVMIDRLNLRPGMKARMLERMKVADLASLPELERSIEDDEYYVRTLDRLRRRCEVRGMRCRDAF